MPVLVYYSAGFIDGAGGFSKPSPIESDVTSTYSKGPSIYIMSPSPYPPLMKPLVRAACVTVKELSVHY